MPAMVMMVRLNRNPIRPQPILVSTVLKKLCSPPLMHAPDESGTNCNLIGHPRRWAFGRVRCCRIHSGTATQPLLHGPSRRAKASPGTRPTGSGPARLHCDGAATGDLCCG